jgi:FMN phosphatase YigB (HAD superfamily)
MTIFTENFRIPAGVNVVSFDVFDTLVLRPFEKPTDIWSFISPEVEKIIGKKINFKKIRKNAEKKARAKSLPAEEVNLDEIYSHLTQIPLKFRNAIKYLEIESEMRLCFKRFSGSLLYEKAKEKGLKIVAISDTYFESSMLKQLLKKIGYEIDIVISSSSVKKTKKSGTIYPEVLNFLGIKAEEMLHIGDNKNSDIEKANKYNIHTFHLPLLRDEFYKNTHYKRLFYKKKKCILTSAIIGAMIEKLDQMEVQPDNKTLFGGKAYNIGFNACGGLLFAFTTWVHNIAEKYKIEKIYFLARDGFIMQKAMQILYKETRFETFYLECSRKSLEPLSVSNVKEAMEVLSKGHRRTTLKNFVIQRLECDPRKLTESDLIEFGFESLNDTVKRKKDIIKIKKVIEFYGREILERFSGQKLPILKYLQGAGLMNKGRFAFCDIGYRGTSQKAIQKIITNKENLGLYFITNSKIKPLKNTFGFLGNSLSKIRFTLYKPFVRLLESIVFSAPFGTVVKYEKNGRVIKENLKQQEAKKLKVNGEVWEGMIEFCIYLQARFKGDFTKLSYDRKSISRMFLDFASAPEKRDAEIAKGVVFENTSNAAGYKGLIENNLWKSGAFSVKHSLIFKVFKPIIRFFVKILY